MDVATSTMLCAAIQAKLQRWASVGEAPEYYHLKNRCAHGKPTHTSPVTSHVFIFCALRFRRGPHKPTITHPLNRFGGNMGPYADALLPLQSVEYINASPIDNLGEGAVPFIATMCPKRETFAHFWSMVWEMDSRVIVNLTHERDRVGSGPSDKRERYWPPLDPTSEKQMSRWPVRPFTLATESCEQVPSLKRFTIQLQGPLPADGSPRPTRTVILYWYSRWVDFPSGSSIGSRPFYANAWAVLHIALHIGAGLDELGPKHWAVCHCSAGVGRTGTFCGLLRVLQMLPQLATEAALDEAVTRTVEAMREKRLWMVSARVVYARNSPLLSLSSASPRALRATKPALPSPIAFCCPARSPLACSTHLLPSAQPPSPAPTSPAAARPPSQVKTDIEYATLYAALLLRLRNPNNQDFTLSWPLTDGSLTSTQGVGGAAEPKRVTPTRTSPGDAAAAAVAAAAVVGAGGAAGGSTIGQQPPPPQQQQQQQPAVAGGGGGEAASVAVISSEAAAETPTTLTDEATMAADDAASGPSPPGVNEEGGDVDVSDGARSAADADAPAESLQQPPLPVMPQLPWHPDMGGQQQQQLQQHAQQQADRELGERLALVPDPPIVAGGGHDGAMGAVDASEMETDLDGGPRPLGPAAAIGDGEMMRDDIDIDNEADIAMYAGVGVGMSADGTGSSSGGGA